MTPTAATRILSSPPPVHSAATVPLRGVERRPIHPSPGGRHPRVSYNGAWEWVIRDGRLTWSDGVYRLFGLAPGEIAPDYTTFLDFVHADDRRRVERAIELALETNHYQVEHRITLRDGRERWVTEQGYVVRGDDGAPARLLGTVSETRTPGDDQLLRSLFNNALEGMLVTDRDTRILMANPAFSEITGYPPEELIGNTPGMLRSGRHGRAFYEELWESLKETGRWAGEIWNRRRDGTLIYLWQTIVEVRDESGEVSHYLSLCSDISPLRRRHEHLEELAFHDPLTGLPNRLLFHDRLDHAMQRARRDGERMAVLFIDLDHFKRVNDTFGHQAGDQLLQEVAQRLRMTLRDRDTVARLGGDEFVVILEDMRREEDAEEIARKILERFTDPLPLGDERLLISLSIGIGLYPEDATDADQLIRRADRALYRTKAGGRNGYSHSSEKRPK